MGGCVSISKGSTYSSRSDEERVNSSCLGISLHSQRRTRTFSDQGNMLQHFYSIPNRIFTNGKGRTACIFTQQGRKGINQDAMIVWEDFVSEDVTLCGVFDGHGPHGHLVARKIRDSLPIKLLSFLDAFEDKKSRNHISCKGNLKSIGGDFAKDVTKDKMDLLWSEVFFKSYKAMDKELKSHPNLDCFCSGSTAITVVKQGSDLFMGYIGDSRAILASIGENDVLVAIQLTVDMKPDLPREAERIKRCKGRVFSMQDEPEVQRVWLPFDNAPGLAMSRAFGDFCLKDYGVISIPEFAHRILTARDKFIVLASDGIWDVLSNEEVVEIVSSAPTRASAARILVDFAAREWTSKYPTSKMDDCAVVCLFLDGKMDSESDNDDQGFSAATLQINHSGHAAEELDDEHNTVSSLYRNCTVQSSEENKKTVVEEEGNDEPVVSEDQNWLGLEGVTRVNSLVQLPRFSEERQTP